MRFKEFLFESIVVPAPPGTVPIPSGHVRLYHQTGEENLDSIAKHGIQFSRARGIEGPRGIYADEHGFYGKPEDRPTVEFHVPLDRWQAPFVVGKDVAPDEIIAIHRPWHRTVRYIESHPETLKQVLAGEHDDLLKYPGDGNAIRYIKQKHGK